MGVTASNGSPSGDLNDFNDLYSFDFTINDDVDLQIESMVPSHNQFASDYYYGEDMVTAVIRNLGYRAVNNTVISFEVSDAQGESINEDQVVPSQYFTQMQVKHAPLTCYSPEIPELSESLHLQISLMGQVRSMFQ